MVKGIKKQWKIVRLLISLVLECLVLFIFLFAYGIQTSYVQTKAAQVLVSYMSNELNTHGSIGYLEVKWPNKLVIHDFYLEDQFGDSLAFFGELEANISDYDLNERRLKINSIVLNDALVSLHKNEGEQEFNLAFIVNYFSSSDSTGSKDFDIAINKVSIRNSEFRFYDSNNDVVPYGVDYSHLKLKRINLELANFNSGADGIMASIDQLSFSERSGFELDSLSTAVLFSDRAILLDTFRLASPNTRMVADELALRYDSLSDLNQFAEKVNISAKIQNSTLGTLDLSYFAPLYKDQKDSVHFSLNASGRLANFTVNDFQLQFGEVSKVKGKGSIVGLPNASLAHFDVQLSELSTTTTDVKNLPFPSGDKDVLQLPQQIESLEYLKGTAWFKGTLDDFAAEANVFSEIGGLGGSVQMHYDSIQGKAVYRGIVNMNNFDVGAIAGVPSVGRVTTKLNLNANGKDAFDLLSLKSEVDAQIDRFDFMGYSYSNILIEGLVSENKFDGILTVDDEHLALDFEGLVDFTTSIPEYNFTAEIQKAHLYDLNLEKSNETQIICSTVAVDGSGSNADNFKGEIVARDLSYYLNGQDYFFDSIYLVSTLDSASHALSVYSNFMDMSIDGTFSIQDLPAAFHTLAGEILPSVFQPSDEIALEEEDFSFFVDVKDLSLITSLFVPDILVAPNTQLNGTYETRSQDLSLNINSDWIHYKNFKLNKVHMETDKFSGLYEFSITSKQADINDSVHLDNLRLAATLFSDNISAGLSWYADDRSNSGNIDWDGYWLAKDQFTMSLNPSIINIEDEVWNIYDRGEITLDSTSIKVANIRAVNGDQIIDVNGVIAEDPMKTLEYTLSQFELSNLNALVTGNTVLLDGQISANGKLRDLYGHPVYQTEFDINECKLNGELLGDVWGLVKPLWNETNFVDEVTSGTREEKIIAFDVTGNIVKEGGYQVDYAGKYFLDGRKEPLDFVFNMNNMNMDVINGLIPEGVSDIAGRIDGNVAMTGSPERVLFDGYLLFNEAAAHIDLLNTDYTFSGRVKIENDGFYMSPGFKILDKYGAAATVWDASFLHINFTDYAYNFQMEMDEPFLVMNTDKTMSSLYYGDAFLTGDVAIAYDKFNELEIEVSARSEKGTNLVLPLDGADEVVLPDFITCVDRSNPLKVEDTEMDLSGVKMKFNMNVTPDAQISLIFDEVVGDIMTGNGTGDITLEIDEYGEFSMRGLYEVNKGDYLFTMFDFINKPFTVRKGGTISWYGNPYNADINLVAVYETKASLYDIMPEGEREEYKGNTEVNCLMKLTENLFSPELEFDIELPKSDDKARAVLENTISSDEELNKQVFSLMVLNKFLPRTNAISSASGSALGAGVGATSSDLISSQIGNWLNALSDDIEIGVNAKLGNQIGEDEIAVAMSKAFLNDRLEISGNFGYSSTNATTSDEQNTRLIGDVNVQYKLNEEGNVRIRAFNESNDYDPMQTTQNSTQGFGIYYKESFNNWWELRQKIANIFRPARNDVLHYRGVGRRKDEDYIKGNPF